MGRETKILLGLLGLLAGVFVGVLSMKLLVPRPPAGAGPDVHADVATSETHDLVAPPDLTGPTPTVGGDEPRPADGYAGRASRFAPATAAAEAPEPFGESERPRQDPFVAPTSLERTADQVSPPPTAPLDPPAAAFPAAAGGFRAPPTTPASPAAAPAAGGSDYVTQPGDSWWSLAERAYGDGRFYRALFAWNRALEPRVSLVPGTALEIPPLDRLRTAWPALTPKP